MNKDFLELFFSFEHLWKFSSGCLKFWKPQALSEYAHLTNSFASRCFSNYLWWRISSFLFVFFFSFLKKFLLVAQSCLTFCDPKDCRWPSSSVHGILQARMLEWVASPFSRRSSWSRDEILVSHIAGGYFTIWTMLFLQFPIHHRPGPLFCSTTNDHMREKNFKWSSALLKQVTCLMFYQFLIF